MDTKEMMPASAGPSGGSGEANETIQAARAVGADALGVGIAPLDYYISCGLLDRKENVEAEAKCEVDGKKVWWFVDQTYGRIPIRIDGDTEATLVAPGGLDAGCFASQHHDEDAVCQTQELFSIAFNPATGAPTTEYPTVSAPRNLIMYTGEDHFANAMKHYYYYEVLINREELMFVRPGFGLPELANRAIDAALDGTRVAVHLTVPECEALNRMRTITGGARVEDFRYDQNGDKVGPSTEERETISRSLERKIEHSLEDAARRLRVEGLGLDGRTLLGIHLERLANRIDDERNFWGTEEPNRLGSRRPRIPTHWPYWVAYWHLQNQASYLSPAAIEARKYGYDTLSGSVREELEKLTRWPRLAELDFSAKTDIVFVKRS